MTFWHQAPFVRLLIPFMAGIILAAFHPVLSFITIAIILLLFSIFIFLSFSNPLNSKYIFRWIYGMILNLLLFVSGYEITSLNTEILYPSHFSKISIEGDFLLATVAESTVSKENSFKTVLKITGIIKQQKFVPATGKILGYFQKDSTSKNIQYGNVLVLKVTYTDIPPPQNPSEFNYKRFLSFHTIYHQAFLKNSEYRILENRQKNNLQGVAGRVSKNLMKIFEKYNISGDEYSVASALMLGSREEIDKDLVQAYSSSGALHVLSVSGLHVGVIFMVMAWLLLFLDKIKYGVVLKTILLLAGLWFYAMLTGLSPSVVRSATMFSFIVVGKSGKRNTNIYNIIASSAFFLFLANPFLIMEVGFQLSYLAVIGIIFFQPKIGNIWSANIPSAGRVGNWFVKQVWTISTISVAAQIATFPLGLLYFHQFPNYFIFSNLFVIPLSTLIIYLGVFLFIVSPLATFAGYVALIFKNCIILLNKSVLMVEKLPYSLLQGISITIIETWLIYFLLIFLICFFIFRNPKYGIFALLVLSFLLIYQIGERYFQQKQKMFCVYNINKTSALDFISGEENYFFSDSSFIKDESRILFHVRHHWWDLGLKKNQLFDIANCRKLKEKEIFLMKNFILFHGWKIVLINKDFVPAKHLIFMKPDFIIISGSPPITLETIKESFFPGEIILDGSNNLFFSRKIMKEAGETGLKCYSVLQSGAFIKELK